jgi:hypothetical protein
MRPIGGGESAWWAGRWRGPAMLTADLWRPAIGGPGESHLKGGDSAGPRHLAAADRLVEVLTRAPAKQPSRAVLTRSAQGTRFKESRSRKEAGANDGATSDRLAIVGGLWLADLDRSCALHGNGAQQTSARGGHCGATRVEMRSGWLPRTTCRLLRLLRVRRVADENQIAWH